VSAELLLDNSSWARFNDLPDSRAIEIGDDLEADRLAICLPFLLEAGVSAVNYQEHLDLQADLIMLPFLSIDARVERRVLAVQAQLARVGHHRMAPPVDLLIAVLAERHGLGVLHYDKHFDLLLEKTDLDFHSEWLMPRGSLN
jgi:predicted nucleic acid-binding protein